MCSTFLLAVVLGLSWPQVLAVHSTTPGDGTADDGTQKQTQRIDSNMDTPVAISVIETVPFQSKLFASCYYGNNALVRFRSLNVPEKGLEFTRYIPNVDQQNLYDLNWRVVEGVTTTTACLNYVLNDTSTMMYQFDGTECRVTTIRMPMVEQTCGDENAEAVMVRTSCPEPTAEVTLTPGPGSMDITWTTDDTCNLASDFLIHWENIENDEIIEVDSDIFYYRIEDRLGCESQTVTVTVWDSFSQQYGSSPTPVVADTLPRGPPKLASLSAEEHVDQVHFTWSISDDECDRINGFYLEYFLNSSYIPIEDTFNDHIFDNETYQYTLTGLHACLPMTYEAIALYDEGTGQSNCFACETSTLSEDPKIVNFTAVSVSFDTVTVEWDLQDYCGYTSGFNLSYQGNNSYIGDYDVRQFVISSLECNTPLTITIIPIDGDGLAIGESGTLEAVTSTSDPKIVNFTAVSVSFDTVTVEWDLQDYCGYTSGFNLSYQGNNSYIGDYDVRQFVISSLECNTPLTITIIPIDGDGLAIGESGTLEAVTSTSAITLGSSAITRAFYGIGASYSLIDVCRLVDHLELEFVSHPPGSPITGCHNVTAAVDALDAQGNSVMDTVTIEVITENSCISDTFIQDICYACLTHTTAQPKFIFSGAQSACTDSEQYLYVPQASIDVSLLTKLMIEDFGYPFDADYTLYVDLTYDSATTDWNWGTTGFVEPATGNWAPGHPDVTIGTCAVLSKGVFFKLKTVDCNSSHYALCMYELEE